MAKLLLILSLFLLGNFAAFAEEMFQTKPGNLLHLSIAPEVGQLDNFLFTPNNERETGYLSVNSKALVQFEHQQQLVTLTGDFTHFKYENFSQDDHTNYRLAPIYRLKLADNQTFYLSATLQNVYEQRGTGLSLGDAESLSVGDTQELTSFKTGYLYGQQNSVAKLALSVGQDDRSYKTRRNITSVLDYQSQFISSSFDYLLSDYSYFASELTYQKVTFAQNALQDKKKLVGLIGFKWQTSAATKLAVLVGYQHIAFERSTFDNDSAFKWQFDWQWHPLESTQVLARSNRDFQEANRLNDSYRVVDAHQITLTHQFNSYLNASLAVGLRQEDVVFRDLTTTEDYLFADTRIFYRRNDWLSFYLRYQYDDLNARENSLNYQASGVSLGINVSI